MISSGPEPIVYRAAADKAVQLRRHIVIIETRIEQEIPWLEFIKKTATKLPVLLSTVKGGTGMSAFTKAPFAVVAPFLHEYRYHPLPIPPGRKGPVANDWQVPREPGYYLPGCAAWGTGILTATCPAIDLDIRDREVVRVLIELADEMLGVAPFRMGAPPKVILLYGTAAPFPKITGRWWALPGEDFGAEGYAPHRLKPCCRLNRR